MRCLLNYYAFALRVQWLWSISSENCFIHSFAAHFYVLKIKSVATNISHANENYSNGFSDKCIHSAFDNHRSKIVMYSNDRKRCICMHYAYTLYKCLLWRASTTCELASWKIPFWMAVARSKSNKKNCKICTHFDVVHIVRCRCDIFCWCWNERIKCLSLPFYRRYGAVFWSLGRDIPRQLNYSCINWTLKIVSTMCLLIT